MASCLTARHPVAGGRAVPVELVVDFPEQVILPVAAGFPEQAIPPVAVGFPEQAIPPVAVGFPEQVIPPVAVDFLEVEVVILVPCSALEVRGDPVVLLLPA